MSNIQSEGETSPAESQQGSSLKKKTVSASIWTIASYGTNQVLRLGSNLLLTRLLFPEAFGLMALVQIFLIGLEMFSDLGIGPSIIHNKRGDEPAFLNTAWTVQVIRGFTLWMCSFLLAWPVAQFYEEPKLIQLLPVSGVTAFLAGLQSTKMATANRNLKVRQLALIELGSYVAGLCLMILWAWQYKSIWALVAGNLLTATLRMILSHVALEGEKNYFYWERGAFQEINRFGRWIFLSSLMYFLASQGDRLVIGRLLALRFLGIYNVALTMSMIGDQVVRKVGYKVLFPSYAKLVRDSPERLYRNLRKSRIILIALNSVISLFFIFFGKQLINLLYDNRYTGAGWILQVLAVGMMIRILENTYSDVLLAKGKSNLMAVITVSNILIRFSAMFLGFYWGETNGLIIGLTCADWLVYIVVAACQIRLSLWQPEVDLPTIALALVGAAFVYFN